MSLDKVTAAHMLKELLILSSPMLEEYTQRVCPFCVNVCCKQKHSAYQAPDMVYLNTLGVAVPSRDGARSLEGPCQFLGAAGCMQPRWLRPFKCTWFFCEPLLKALNDGQQKKARALSAMLQEMIRLVDKLGNERSNSHE